MEIRKIGLWFFQGNAPLCRIWVVRPLGRRQREVGDLFARSLLSSMNSRIRCQPEIMKRSAAFATRYIVKRVCDPTDVSNLTLPYISYSVLLGRSPIGSEPERTRRQELGYA